jgi:hypothetical protein
MHVNGKMHGYQNSFIFKAHSFCAGITVSFSTGSFFLFQVTLFTFQVFFPLFRFLLFFGEHERLGVTSTSFGIVTQQISVGITRRHPVGVDDAPHNGNLVHI